MRPAVWHKGGVLALAMAGAFTFSSLATAHASNSPQNQAAESSATSHIPDIMPLPQGVGGPFSLKDPVGHTVSSESLKGQWVLLFFGYTTCPDICPTQLQTMMSALARLPASQAEHIQPVFITIDPKRDTAEKLADYATMFGPRLLALRGSDEETKAVQKAYQVYSAPSASAPPSSNDDDTYAIDHTSLIYLLAPDGSVANAFSPVISAKSLAAALAGLEAPSPSSKP